MSEHKFIGYGGYAYKVACCSCGWRSRKQPAPYHEVDAQAKQVAKGLWEAHAARYRGGEPVELPNYVARAILLGFVLGCIATTLALHFA